MNGPGAVPALHSLAAAFVALLMGCSAGPVRTQSLYFAVRHAALLIDPDGRGSYALELRSVRKVTGLSVVRISFDRPGGVPYTREITVRAGQRRFVFQTPTLGGFGPDERYAIRLVLIGPDRTSRLDRLVHYVEPTVVGTPDR